MCKVENFKSFLGSSHAEFDESYQSAVDKVGPPVTRADQKINYKQLYFQVIDTIVGMLNEIFQDLQSLAFPDLVYPKLFRSFEGKVPSNKIDLLKERYGPLFDIPLLESQLKFIYMDTDFHKETSMAIFTVYFSA